MRASNNTKPRPLESNILRREIVISSTSVLGQASQSAIVKAISLMSSYSAINLNSGNRVNLKYL
jgi:hypothetical protein